MSNFSEGLLRAHNNYVRSSVIMDVNVYRVLTRSHSRLTKDQVRLRLPSDGSMHILEFTQPGAGCVDSMCHTDV